MCLGLQTILRTFWKNIRSTKPAEVPELKKLLGKKISRAKWTRPAGVRLQADSVNDLRTANNTLSFWECGNESVANLDDLVLAMVLGTRREPRDRIDTLDVVWIQESELKSADFELVQSTGDTIVEALTTRHYDVANLVLEDIPRIGNLLDRSIQSQRVRRYTRPDVARVIQSGRTKGMVTDEMLDPGLKRDLEAILAPKPKKKPSKK